MVFQWWREALSLKQKRTVEEIGQRFQDLTISLNACREELISGAQELKKEKLNTLKIQQEELELTLDIVQRSEGFTEKTIKHGSEVEIYILRRVLLQTLKAMTL